MGVWEDLAYDAVMNVKKDNPREYNQVIALPLPDGYTCGTPLVQNSPTTFAELTNEHWNKVRN